VRSRGHVQKSYDKSSWKGVWGRTFFQEGFPQLILLFTRSYYYLIIYEIILVVSYSQAELLGLIKVVFSRKLVKKTEFS